VKFSVRRILTELVQNLLTNERKIMRAISERGRNIVLTATTNSAYAQLKKEGRPNAVCPIL